MGHHAAKEAVCCTVLEYSVKSVLLTSYYGTSHYGTSYYAEALVEVYLAVAVVVDLLEEVVAAVVRELLVSSK